MVFHEGTEDDGTGGVKIMGKSVRMNFPGANLKNMTAADHHIIPRLYVFHVTKSARVVFVLEQS